MTSERPSNPWWARLPSFVHRAGWHARLDAFVVGTICLIDALVTTHLAGVPIPSRVVVSLASLSVGASAGALLGVVQSFLIRALLAGDSWLEVGARLDQALDKGTRDRSRVVSFHATVLGTALFGVLAAGAYASFLLVSDRIKEEALRSWLLVLFAAVGVFGVPLLSALFAPLIDRLVVAVDRRIPLPLPAHPAVRFALFGLLPALAVALPLFVVFGVKLGVLAYVFGALVFVSLVRLCALVWLSLIAWLRPGLLPTAVSYAILALFGVLSVVIPSLSDGAGYWLSRGAVVPHVTRALQAATDVDRDGVSSLFGGGDCAPFDASRSPARREVGGNGKDENCDGKDAPRTAAQAEYPRFFGRLPVGAVQRYNVLWYVVDSLRADHLPLHGYRKNTSPALTRLGKQAWVFDKAYSQSSNTTLSMPSMLSGRWPGSLAWRRSYYPVAEPGDHLLPEQLSRAGYYTGLLMNDWVLHKVPGIQHGFRHKLSASAEFNWKSGQVLFSKTLLAMEAAREAGQPFFLVIHVDDVHHPYVAARGHAVPDFPNQDKAIADYDKGIALFDNTLSHLLAHLDDTGRSKDTVLIVTADHGEEFLEHGGTIHSRTCYRESVHVPLVVRIPGQPPRRIESPVSLADVVPMLLELLGMEDRGTAVDGQSLLIPVMAPGEVDADRPIFCNIFQMLGGRQNFFTQTVRAGNSLLVHELLNDTVELYDTRADPLEKHDLSKDPARVDEVARLKALVQSSLTGNLFEARTFQ